MTKFLVGISIKVYMSNAWWNLLKPESETKGNQTLESNR